MKQLSFWTTVNIVLFNQAIPVGWLFYYLNLIQDVILGWLDEIYLDKDLALESDAFNSSSTNSTESVKYSEKSLYLFSTASSLIFIGAIIGNLIFGYLADKIGRKLTLLLASLSMVLSILVMLSSYYLKSAIPLILGRVITGLSLGGIVPICSLYLSEISTLKHRGAISSSFLVGMALGTIFQYIFSLEKVLGTDEYWHYLLLIVIIFKMPFYCFYKFIPESPIYLKKIGKNEEARRTIVSLYREEEVDYEDHSKGAPKRRKSKIETMDMRVSRNDTNTVSNNNQAKLTEQDTTLTLQDIKHDSTLHKMLIYITILCLGHAT